MADNLTLERAQQIADQAKDLANHVSALNAKINSFLAFNSAQALDWGGQSLPTPLTEDPVGNITGKRYTRQQIANVIGTFAAIQTLMGQGHIGNINLVADPLPIR